MPVSIKGSGGGSVTLDASTAASDTTLTMPNVSGTILQSGTAVTAAQGGTGLTSVGTAGNVLTSNGSAWTSTAPASTGINVQSFTGSGTWTKPSLSASSRVLIQAWGGGASGSKNGSNPGGGGGGGYNEWWFTLSALGATETVTIGAGGTARSTNGTGNAGGNTTVGSLITAYGGGGGGTSAVGGGGGGQLSAGGSGDTATPRGVPGRPILSAPDSPCLAPYAQGSGSNTSGTQPIDAFWHGGGGGGGAGSSNQTPGNWSVFGGGGGGGYDGSVRAGGTSRWGGNGGASGTTGVAGTAPGGGGGGSTSGNSGAGASGQVIITVFPA